MHVLYMVLGYDGLHRVYAFSYKDGKINKVYKMKIFIQDGCKAGHFHVKNPEASARFIAYGLMDCDIWR